MSPVESCREGFRFEGAFSYIDDLVVSDLFCSGALKWRESAHVANDGHEYYKLRRYQRGGAVFISDGEPVCLGQGATYLLSQSRPFTEISQDNQQLNVFVSAKALGVDASQLPPIMEFRDQSSEGAIVLAALQSLFAAARSTRDRLQSEVSRAFCNTMREVVRGGSESLENRDLNLSRRQAIEAEIEKHLASPNFTVDQMIERLPFSRASLYRYFRVDGGIASYIRRRRLGLAFERLSKAREYGAVSRVAEGSGYGSIHSFHKAFRREFGCAPGEVVGSKAAVSLDVSPAVSGVVGEIAEAREFKRAFQKIRVGE